MSLSLVAATAGAAGVIGALAASAASAPSANAGSSPTVTGHAGSGASAGRPAPAAKPQQLNALELDSVKLRAPHSTAKVAGVGAVAARHAPAKPARVHHAPAAPRVPYQVYDSVTPSAIPHGHQIAVYANGAYTASASNVAGRGHVLWIDTNGSDTKASALDVEPGDATPSGAASWVHAKLDASHKSVAIVYTMISQWQAVKDNVGALPQWMHSHVRYWIADPTGVQHVLPGANATQWYWGNSYDITTANPGFQS